MLFAAVIPDHHPHCILITLKSLAGDWFHDEDGLDDVSCCGNTCRAGNFEGGPALVGGQAKTTAGELAQVSPAALR